MTVELLGVPPQYREALARLADLPEDRAGRLIDAIAAVGPLASVGVIGSAAQSALEEDESLHADRLIPPLLSLRSELRDESADEIAETLSRSVDLELDAGSRQRLKERAAKILRTPAVSTTGVAIDLLTQHQRNYRSARIFTDVRPLFGEDVELPPVGAVIIEMLQLQTWDRDGQVAGPRSSVHLL